MFIKIEIDTEKPLSGTDKAMLRGLLGEDGTTVINVQGDVGNPTETAAAVKKAVAKKTTPSATDAERAKAPPANEGAVDGHVGEEPDVDVKQAARDRASFLLSNGKRPEVQAALEACGGGKSRVSDVDAEHLPGLLKALTAITV